MWHNTFRYLLNLGDTRLDRFKSECHLQMNPQSREALGIFLFSVGRCSPCTGELAAGRLTGTALYTEGSNRIRVMEQPAVVSMLFCIGACCANAPESREA